MRKSHKQKVRDKKQWRWMNKWTSAAADKIRKQIDDDFIEMIKSVV